MHFFYLDESGCTGADLKNQEQPIFVLGGISVKAQGWRETTETLARKIDKFFGGKVPPKFELHATDLFNCKGAFSSHGREDCHEFILDLLNILEERKHATMFVAVKKESLASALPGKGHPVLDCQIPYLLSFNYMMSYIEKYTKDRLGSSARAMIILDQKDSYHSQIDSITHYRRYEVAKARRLKWLVEFSYPVDSVRHPMIQLSDLVVFLVRKFLEVEHGYRPSWPSDAKNFVARCYGQISSRSAWSGLLDVPGKEEEGAHDLLRASHCTHRKNWRRYYSV